MAANWPPDLPFFNRADGHTRTGRVGAVIRTQMDRGPKKSRRVSTAAPRRYEGQIPQMSILEFTTFEAFMEEVIADGALPFQAEDPLDGLTKTFMFTDDPAYQATPVGKGMQVTASLEVVGRPPRAVESTSARISGDPVQAFPGDTLYAERAVYAGEPGALVDEWYRASTGEVVGNNMSYVVRQSDAFDHINYRTRPLNGPLSAAVPVKIDAVPPQDILTFNGEPLTFGTDFITFNTADVTQQMTWNGDPVTWNGDPMTFTPA